MTVRPFIIPTVFQLHDHLTDNAWALAGVPIDCANAAVDPKDRNHFLYSKGGEYRAWESYDAGKTVNMIVNATAAAYLCVPIVTISLSHSHTPSFSPFRSLPLRLLLFTHAHTISLRLDAHRRLWTHGIPLTAAVAA